jgi:ABC-2 type transport system ATP-binding protein
VLNLSAPCKVLPAISEFKFTRVEDQVIEVEVSKEQNLNALFEKLSTAGIEVVSMRNKVNRLEEIFMQLVDNRNANA